MAYTQAYLGERRAESGDYLQLLLLIKAALPLTKFTFSESMLLMLPLNNDQPAPSVITQAVLPNII